MLLWQTRFWLLTGIAFTSGFAASLGASDFRVADYGAIGDGKTLCTIAINRAVDVASSAGGGVVVFPPGTWLTGTIELQSHVTLRLDPGSTILGSTNVDDYPVKLATVESYTANYTHRSLIYAQNLDDISIDGNGTIDGNGGAYPRIEGSTNDYVRPYLMRVINCRDVRVSGVSLKNPAMWTQHYLACDRVRISGIRVWAFANHNNDAIDVDGCHDVIISDCILASEDDGITLKSSSKVPCQNVVISDCVVSSRSSPIKFGTETVGGFENVTIANCVVRPPPPESPHICTDGRNGLTGIELIIADGGYMKRVNIANITIEGMQVPISVELNARGRGLKDPNRLPESGRPERLPVGSIKDVSFESITATGADKNCGVLLVGLPGHPLENISLSNITIRNAGGGESSLANRAVPERAYDYPQAAWWGNMPAFGLYARHVNGLNISNVRLQTSIADARHALALDDVRDACLDKVTCMPASGTNALLCLSQSCDVLIRGMQPRSASGAFLKLNGAECSHIGIIGNDLSQVARLVDLAKGARTQDMSEVMNINRPSAKRDAFPASSDSK